MVVAMALGGIAGYAVTRSTQSDSGSVGTTSAATSTSSTGTSTSTSTTKLTLAEIEAAVDPALVDVTSTLGSTGTAEGTGIVISSTGEILTNNHVISGATSITVKIGGTGKSYSATVIGYDVSHDVAALQIANVSGLKTITTADASTVAANDTVVAIGNALGKGGTPVAAEGVVTAIDQTITASDETGSSSETLNGLIQISAAVQPGDSGGATVNQSGQVIGMTTAAASSGYRPMSTSADASSTTAYAIPIASGLSIARQIETGTETSTVHIGEHGLLGVEVQTSADLGGTTSVAVGAVQPGSAAANAGLTAGDAIVSISGRSISSISDLNDAMDTTHVGDKTPSGGKTVPGGRTRPQ